ncbi:MAG: NOB1 family endonuclease [Candidatus Thermoplasmatota archaeon]
MYIVDTSAILSGKPLQFNQSELVTTPGVTKELSPGGKDYRNFVFLQEKGLKTIYPSDEAMNKINAESKKTGDKKRLSDTDKEILAAALDLQQKTPQATILTDDYSIQNMADSLNIKYENISQRGIKKKFKWATRCRGCGRYFKEDIDVCPVCGSETKTSITDTEDTKKE